MNILRSRRTLGVTAALIIAGASYAAGRATASTSSTGPTLAGFGARSYAPGQVAVLNIDGDQTSSAILQIFQAGASGTPGPAAAPGWDKNTFGKPVTEPQQVRRPAGAQRWLVHIRLGSTWASGDYVARLTWPGHIDYAPFVLRPSRLGTAPVLVVEPTNTWHAYDDVNGDSWYLDSSVHTIDLTNPFGGTRVNGKAVPAGLPEQFQRFDVGLLRWYWHSGYRADFISDDDLERVANARQLSHYRLIVFGGHEEYVTSHTVDLITALPQQGRQPRVPVRQQLLLQGRGLGEHDDRPPPVARPRPAGGRAPRRAVRRLERGQLSEPALPHHRTPQRRRGCSRARVSTTAAESATTASRWTSRTARRRRAPTCSPSSQTSSARASQPR